REAACKRRGWAATYLDRVQRQHADRREFLRFDQRQAVAIHGERVAGAEDDVAEIILQRDPQDPAGHAELGSARAVELHKLTGGQVPYLLVSVAGHCELLSMRIIHAR